MSLTWMGRQAGPSTQVQTCVQTVSTRSGIRAKLDAVLPKHNVTDHSTLRHFCLACSLDVPTPKNSCVEKKKSLA